MRSAVIVSTARTPIGRAYRGAFNHTQSQALGGHVIANAAKQIIQDDIQITVGGGMGAAGLFEVA